MPEAINMHQAKTHLSRLVDRVSQGEEFVIAKSGKPQARLVPLSLEVRQPGLYQGMIEGSDTIFEPLPEEELDAWEA
ncbi:MAG: type II toxin-antitoxin system Phd/YefM family antitoxin [Verrucomicrobiota bacterium]